MKVNTLKNPQINQNGYHKNVLTKERIGTLFIYPIDFTPDDCLSCEGYSLQISDYEDLYKVIGTKFNKSGDASGTFRIPDYNVTGRFLQPSQNAGGLIEAGLPKHTHTGTLATAGAHTHTANSAGAHKHYEFASAVDGTSSDNKTTQQLTSSQQVNSLWYSGYAAYVLARTSSPANVGLSSSSGVHTHTTDSQGGHTHKLTIDETSGSLYGTTSTVQPPSQLVHICIKYK